MVVNDFNMLDDSQPLRIAYFPEKHPSELTKGLSNPVQRCYSLADEVPLHVSLKDKRFYDFLRAINKTCVTIKPCSIELCFGY